MNKYKFDNKHNESYAGIVRKSLPGYVNPRMTVYLFIISVVILPVTAPQNSFNNLTFIQKACAEIETSLETLPEPKNKFTDQGMVEYKIEPKKENRTQQEQQKEEPEKKEPPKKEPAKPKDIDTEQPEQQEAKPEQPTAKDESKTETSKPSGENLPQTKDKQENIAENNTNREHLVTNMFYDTPVRQALADISAQTGVIILPDISVQGIVTCELREVPLEQALQIILSSGNFAYRQMEGYILVGTADIESPSFSKLSQTRRIKMNYLKADEAVKMLSEPIRKLAIANPTNNVVSVTAPEELLEGIISNLKLFDQPTQHVILDARIVALEHGNLLNLGIQWNWPGITAGTFSNSDHHGSNAPELVNWPWGIQIGYTPGQEFTNSLMMTLNLLTQNDEAIVIASPQVLAQDGHEAEIKVVTEEYFKITQEAYYYTRFELETIETGTILTITPLIGDNNEITLNVAAEVSDVIARGQDNLPVVTRRTTKNTVRVENGGTAVVAGLMDSRKRYQKSRTPGLSGIPILGSLFDNTNTTDSARQVAVFITARLMPETGRVIQKSIEEQAPIKLAGNEFRKSLQKALIDIKRENSGI